MATVITAFCILITWKSEARHTPSGEIYSTLTTDTIPRLKKDPGQLRDTVPSPNDSSNRVGDSTQINDSLPEMVVDTFNFKFSKDTLDAPINYEAADSGVLLIKEKKFLLYGNTKTTYKDIVLTAPQVEMDQATNILTALNSKDSLGDVVSRAVFTQGSQGFQADTIRFNFKTQRGLTKNTYTKQNEMWVQAPVIKKVSQDITFARHVIFTTCDFDDPHFGFVAGKAEFVNNKVAITGPIHPEFEGVALPVYLPFGLFPLKQGRHSGLLPPQFTVTEQFGLGLEGLGYYHVLNDYLDVTTRANIYSYGGWILNITPTYRKRYKYDGQLNVSLQRTKLNFKGDPDYSVTKTFRIGWQHSVNPKARPGLTFGANVNIASSKYNQYLPNNPYTNFDNQMQSSIALSKRWEHTNLTLSANHNQNNVTRDMRFTLPDAGFTVNTFYPFQRKKIVGNAKWYEKIGFGYNGVARNQLAFNDSVGYTLNKLLDTMLWGAQHRFPISMSLPPLGPLLINPFISYDETWLTDRIGREWDPVSQEVVTAYKKQGLFIDRQMSFGIGLNTTIYGTRYFKKGKMRAIRHVIRPNINFNYRPNLSSKYYDVIQVDTQGHEAALPQFQANRNLFSPYPYGKFGGMSFSVDNNLEMKWKGKKDTTAEGKKIRIIDGFGFSSAYNFLQDSLQLLPFNLYLRTTLFEKVSITAQTVWNPYQQEEGRYVNRFVWQGDRFSLGRLGGGSVSMSTSFQSKPRNSSKGPSPQPRNSSIGQDPALMGDQERLQEYIRRNPAEFVDFNVPWSLNLSYSLSFSPQFDRTTGKTSTDVNSSLTFNNSFSLTPKWNFTTSGFYDFNSMKLSMFTMSISRDMHCWQMSVNVTPIGMYRTFNISINPKSSILQDLRVNRTRSFSDF